MVSNSPSRSSVVIVPPTFVLNFSSRPPPIVQRPQEFQQAQGSRDQYALGQEDGRHMGSIDFGIVSISPLACAHMGLGYLTNSLLFCVTQLGHSPVFSSDSTSGRTQLAITCFLSVAGVDLRRTDTCTSSLARKLKREEVKRVPSSRLVKTEDKADSTSGREEKRRTDRTRASDQCPQKQGAQSKSLIENQGALEFAKRLWSDEVTRDFSPVSA
ncbi:hypothetical protein Scep_024262 [Stephania cephalantha]|uniref:Uncharacterized protein n=1 Tax=Stephania cephalantha TaxID=152367 RepID=A0AAP0F1N7_9MAGN